MCIVLNSSFLECYYVGVVVSCYETYLIWYDKFRWRLHMHLIEYHLFKITQYILPCTVSTEIVPQYPTSGSKSKKTLRNPPQLKGNVFVYHIALLAWDERVGNASDLLSLFDNIMPQIAVVRQNFNNFTFLCKIHPLPKMWDYRKQTMCLEIMANAPQ